MSLAATDCSRCALYAEVRGPRILAEIRKLTDDTTETTGRWVKFLNGYHDLHAEQHEDIRRTAGRYVALMALVTEDDLTGGPGAVDAVVKPGGSDARPAPPKVRPSASRSARPSEARNGHRHGSRRTPPAHQRQEGLT